MAQSGKLDLQKLDTFKVNAPLKVGSKRFELHKHLQATLGSGDLT